MAGRSDVPVLDEGSRVVRQVEAGETRFIVRAGTTGKYLRVGEPEAAILELLDGERNLEQVRRAYMARRRESIALAEVAGFVNRMRSLGVVRPTVEASNLMLIEKARQRRVERRFSGRFGSLLFLRRKLFDPDRILSALVGPLGFFFTRGFVIFGAVLVVVAAGILTARWGDVAAGVKNFGSVLGASGLSLWVLWGTALVVVFLHEFGHGLACKHFGGDVHEMGVLLLFFQPCFYCNVNDAWTFQSRAARLWVTAAGGVIETVIGSACVVIWAVTEPGSLVHELCRVVFTMSLSMTLLFNMNPLIKLDGYYLLADLLGIENLRERSMGHLKWFIRARMLRLPADRITEDPREGRILIAYALASSTYMGLLILMILTLLAGAVLGGGGPGIGVILVLGALAWLLLKQPVMVVGGAMVETAKHMRESGAARRALRIAGVAAAVVALASFVVPWTPASTAICVVEPARIADIRSGPAGRIVDVIVAGGARVQAGAPLFRVAAPEEEAAVRAGREGADRLRAMAMERRASGDTSGAEVLDREAEAAAGKLREAEERLSRAVATSPIDGVVMGERLAEIEGVGVQRDQRVLRVGDVSRLRVHCAMTARDSAPLRVGMGARVRLHALPGEWLVGEVVSISGRPIDETHPAGAALHVPAGPPRWAVEVEVPNPGMRALPGMTGETRVDLGRTTVAGAAWSAVRSTFRTDVFR